MSAGDGIKLIDEDSYNWTPAWSTSTSSSWGSSTATSSDWVYQTNGLRDFENSYKYINAQPIVNEVWSDNDEVIWIDKDGNMVSAPEQKIQDFYTPKEKILEEILMKLMNEIILRKHAISEGLKYEISSLLKEVEEIEQEEKDDGFISKKEMLV